MFTLTRSSSDNPYFISLVKLLDADLAQRDGSEHSFYAQFNKIDNIKHVVIAFKNDEPVGCGAIKEFSPEAAEVKRMYVLPEERGKGLASKILHELEAWAYELSFKRCVLETGKRQPEAIALYLKNGYERIENYGQYAGIENSLCFAKRLSC
jgi:putative acetyltransferase